MKQMYIKLCEEQDKWSILFTIDISALKTQTETNSDILATRKYTLKGLNGPHGHCFLKELQKCDNCRLKLLQAITSSNNANTLKIILTPMSTWPDTIDHNWNARLNCLIHERSELDNTLSWLSTLGGAFSALGDYYSKCAETAGKISMQQLELAVRLGDANVASRCRLYFALSLIQKKRFRGARRIIFSEYHAAREAVVCDQRLLKMCQGIWAKLKYEKMLHQRG